MQTLSNNKFPAKTLNVLFWLSGLILTFYLTDLFLKRNFSYDGEAYMKGAGHLLREDLWKGLFFIITRQLFATTIIFYLLFYLLPVRVGQLAFRVFTAVWVIIIILTLFYAGSKAFDVIELYNYSMILIENTLTWLFRATGYFFGYWMAVKNVGKVNPARAGLAPPFFARGKC